MSPSIYVSVPITVPSSQLNSAILELGCLGYQLKVWKRDERYNPDMLSDSDAVVFFANGWSWDMPSGCWAEYVRAKQLGKKVFLLYKTASGTYNLYECKNIEKTIVGIAGTGFQTPGVMKLRIDEWPYDRKKNNDSSDSKLSHEVKTEKPTRDLRLLL